MAAIWSNLPLMNPNNTEILGRVQLNEELVDVLTEEFYNGFVVAPMLKNGELVAFVINVIPTKELNGV